MATSLEQILATTRSTLGDLAARRGELELAASRAPAVPRFRDALRRDCVGLIAEVKRRSPSAGIIRETIDPRARAATYAALGASAISVLTDGPWFGGSLADLADVSAGVSVPTLRKDFILAEEQVLEARAAGAAAVLLIVRALERTRLLALLQFSRELGLDALVEAHTESELQLALECGSTVVGINSRDLDTFSIDVERAWHLLALVPSDVIAVAESGMASATDVGRAAQAGADAVLIGTALSRADDPAPLIHALAGVPRRGR